MPLNCFCRYVWLGFVFLAVAQGKLWEVPMGGNAYVTKQDEKQGGDGRWTNPGTVHSFYFHVDRPANLTIGLKAGLSEGESELRMTVDGEHGIDVRFKAGEQNDRKIDVPIAKAGYVKVDLQGVKKSGEVFAEVEAVTVDAPDDVVLNYVKDNEGNRFYWGRRGPSVHLGYPLPKGDPIEWFYNEITVPEGSDPIGSYFMSNGFGEGYFGMQVNGEKERRILFSVWSPFSTDNPKEIPEDQRITLLKKGEGVHGGEFGGEGSGGQSYWRYPWKAGETYRFLNRVKPDGRGSTDYSAWFYLPEKKEWKLIASFKRPKTDKHLTGAHSFLENFSDRQGYLSRGAFYGNQWACDVNGT